MLSHGSPHRRTHQHSEDFPQRFSFEPPHLTVALGTHGGSARWSRLALGSRAQTWCRLGLDEALGREDSRGGLSMRKDGGDRRTWTGLGPVRRLVQLQTLVQAHSVPPEGRARGTCRGIGIPPAAVTRTAQMPCRHRACEFSLPSTCTVVTRYPRAIFSPLPQVCVNCHLLHEAFADHAF